MALKLINLYNPETGKIKRTAGLFYIITGFYLLMITGCVIVSPSLKIYTPSELGKVNVAKLEVKSCPDSYCETIAFLKKGQKVPIKQVSEYWVQLKWDKQAWVYKEHLILPDGLKSNSNNNKAIANKNKSLKIAKVTADKLNVRAGPDTMYSIVDTLKKGDEVYIDLKAVRQGFICEGDWFKLARTGTKEAWVYGKYLDLPQIPRKNVKNKNKTIHIETKRKSELTEGQINLLSKLQRQKYILIEYEHNTAYIEPMLWINMNIKTKEDFAATLAIYCANMKGSELYYVDIYDKYSGKKLARFSKNWGFKVY